MENKAKWLFAFLFLLLLANLYLWHFLFTAFDNKLKVSFFDVGEGEAVLVETPQGNRILIDGGGDETILEKLREKIPLWDRRIDVVILSRPVKNRLNGLIFVLKKYKIRNIVWSGRGEATGFVRQWQKEIREGKYDIILAKAGEKIVSGDVSLSVLYPQKNSSGELGKVNDGLPIVLKLVYGRISFLFASDATAEIENDLCEIGCDLRATVLSVSRHGSKAASSQLFLTRVAPLLGIISCGKDNIYHHPSQEVLSRLKNFGIKVLRTDQDGDIEIISNGKQIYLGNKIT